MKIVEEHNPKVLTWEANFPHLNPIEYLQEAPSIFCVKYARRPCMCLLLFFSTIDEQLRRTGQSMTLWKCFSTFTYLTLQSCFSLDDHSFVKGNGDALGNI